MLPENRLFWIRGDDDKEYGPVNLEELREWVRENRAGLGTFVRTDQPDAPWQHWQQYPELVALLAEVQAAAKTPDSDAPDFSNDLKMADVVLKENVGDTGSWELASDGFHIGFYDEYEFGGRGPITEVVVPWAKLGRFLTKGFVVPQ